MGYASSDGAACPLPWVRYGPDLLLVDTPTGHVTDVIRRLSAAERDPPVANIALRGAMHRLFVAIRPPEPIRDLLIDAMDDSADFRWQDEGAAAPHPALHRRGRPAVAEDLAAYLARIRRAIHFRISALAASSSATAAPYGPASNRKSLWPRSRRRSSASAWVGLEPERRAYHPHITLARWKGRRTREVADFLEAGAAWFPIHST